MPHESGEQFAMRSRVARTSSNGSDSPTYKDIVLIERKLKPDDTLNKLAIKYAVNVSEIKRVNGIINENEILAMSKVKIPVSRMRIALGVNPSTSQDEDENYGDERTHLIEDETRNSRDPSAEEIFSKTDSNIAQVRGALPEDRLHGSFHFVDAKPPDSGNFSIWAIVIGVIVIFCVLPLLLTFYEEHEEAAASHPGHSHEYHQRV